ncbi:MAG: hypothetical protein JO053_05670 [Acidobacteria bacterium]|nr:hypothetical protein [Acidobacteriota bacterium]
MRSVSQTTFGLDHQAPQPTVTTASRLTASADVALLRSSLRRWTYALLASGAIGAFAGVTGLAMNALFVLGFAENRGPMGLLGVWLLVAAFPMLWLTSHCLDRVDSIDKAIRLERCRRTGLTNISPGNN